MFAVAVFEAIEVKGRSMFFAIISESLATNLKKIRQSSV
jgi:hypothetical protein